MIVGSSPLLKNLQMTKNKTQEEREQTLEAQHCWKTYKQLESKHMKKKQTHEVVVH